MPSLASKSGGGERGDGSRMTVWGSARSQVRRGMSLSRNKLAQAFHSRLICPACNSGSLPYLFKKQTPRSNHSCSKAALVKVPQRDLRLHYTTCLLHHFDLKYRTASPEAPLKKGICARDTFCCHNRGFVCRRWHVPHH